MLTEADREFLTRRRKSLGFLRAATWALPLFWVVGIVYAITRFPALIDPMGVAADLDGGQIEWGVLRALARMAPMLFLVVVSVVTGTLYLFLRSAHREKRLLDLVDRADRGSVSPPL